MAVITFKLRNAGRKVQITMWDTQSVQVVWFFRSHDGLSAAALFQSAFGLEAENVQTNRSVTPSTPFLSQASAVIENRSVTLQVQPGRLDLVVQGDQTNHDPAAGPNVLNLTDEMARLAGTVAAISAMLTSVVRLATVATLTTPAASGEDALKKCIDNIGIACPTSGVTDFIFQANKRAVLGDTFEVNRLLRWNVFAFHSVAMNADAFGQQVLSELVSFRPALMLDFNTLLQDAPYSRDAQISAMRLIHAEILRFAQLERPLQEFF